MNNGMNVNNINNTMNMNNGMNVNNIKNTMNMNNAMNMNNINNTINMNNINNMNSNFSNDYNSSGMNMNNNMNNNLYNNNMNNINMNNYNFNNGTKNMNNYNFNNGTKNMNIINPNFINNMNNMNINNMNCCNNYNICNNNNNFPNIFYNNFNTLNSAFPFYQFNPFNINGNNYNYNYNLFMEKFLQNKMFEKLFYQTMLQQFMYNLMYNYFLFQKYKQMQKKFATKEKNNNKQCQMNGDYLIKKDLIDVIKEPIVPIKFYDNDFDDNRTTVLSFDLNLEIFTSFMQLNPNLLSSYGNNLTGNWAKNEYRGGRRYNPPKGWIGFGLNVLNKYDHGNNDWLACNGRAGEWCVAYHGVCRLGNFEKVKETIKLILESNLKPGKGQSFKNSNDSNHPGRKVGIGVYCSPDVNVLEEYAGILKIQGKRYQVGFMLRVKPDKIRIPSDQKNYWVLNGNFDEIRPYRLLIKKI
jgi:hypothetical protein